MLEVAAISERGTSRNTNQDACLLKLAQVGGTSLTMAVVCDGVGGLSRGELASSLVTHELSAWFEHDLVGMCACAGMGLGMREVGKAWDELISSAHERLRLAGESGRDAMGTTLTGIVAYGGTYVAVQVGDGRLYSLHNGKVECLTRDQTVAARLLEEGKIDARQIEGHPGRHVILQAIGAGSDVRPVFQTGSYEPDDYFFLCTDGVYGCLDDHMLCGELGKLGDSLESVESVCQRLVNMSLETGETDNLTVVCFRGEPLGDSESNTVVLGGERPW